MLPDVGEPVIGHRDPQPGQRREPAFDLFERLVDWFFTKKFYVPDLNFW